MSLVVHFCLEHSVYMGCTLTPPGEYDWTVHVQRRCGLISNYFDHLLSICCSLLLQKTPVSRFIIGYCGAVTSAVGIAVRRFLFAVSLLLLGRIAVLYVDAAYRYCLSSVVCWSVCMSVCHTNEPCKNGCTDRDAVWVVGSDGPRESCVTWGPKVLSDIAMTTNLWTEIAINCLCVNNSD